MKDAFPQFIKQFMKDLYGEDTSSYPDWVVGALQSVNVDLRPTSDPTLKRKYTSSEEHGDDQAKPTKKLEVK